MKAMVATKVTQGRRGNDFHFAKDGEIVIFGSECDGEAVDGNCGCRRAMIGCESRRATTTFEVRDVEVDSLEDTVRASLEESGWIGKEWSDPASDDQWVREDAAELARIADHFPVGTVLEKRGCQFKVRKPYPVR